MNAICAVHHTDGRVQAFSHEIALCMVAIKRESALAIEARGVCTKPNWYGPWSSCTAVPERLVTPDASKPGGPGAPGYSPSTMRTSRKFNPTARTLSSPYLSRVPARMPAGLEDASALLSTQIAEGRKSSKQFSKLRAPSPGVAFLSPKSLRFFRAARPESVTAASSACQRSSSKLSEKCDRS